MVGFRSWPGAAGCARMGLAELASAAGARTRAPCCTWNSVTREPAGTVMMPKSELLSFALPVRTASCLTSKWKMVSSSVEKISLLMAITSEMMGAGPPRRNWRAFVLGVHRNCFMNSGVVTSAVKRCLTFRMVRKGICWVKGAMTMLLGIMRSMLREHSILSELVRSSSERPHICRATWATAADCEHKTRDVGGESFAGRGCRSEVACVSRRGPWLT